MCTNINIFQTNCSADRRKLYDIRELRDSYEIRMTHLSKSAKNEISRLVSLTLKCCVISHRLQSQLHQSRSLRLKKIFSHGLIEYILCVYFYKYAFFRSNHSSINKTFATRRRLVYDPSLVHSQKERYLFWELLMVFLTSFLLYFNQKTRVALPQSLQIY